MSDAAVFSAEDGKQAAIRMLKAKRNMAFAVPGVLIAYLLYVFFAFDVPGLVDRARMDNAALLVADSYSHKIHVTRDGRNNGDIRYAIEGETKGAFPPGERPSWVSGDATDPVIALAPGG